MPELNDQWNVPGTEDYDATVPLDFVLRATGDQEKRGYWLAYNRYGHLLFISNQNNADGVHIEEDGDGYPVIVWGVETEEFGYDGVDISIERYS